MPGPAAAAIPFAAFVGGPGAVAAAKHLAFHAANSAYNATAAACAAASSSGGAAAAATATTAGFEAALAVICLRWAIRKLPDWVREDISFRNLLTKKNKNSGKNDDDDDDDAAISNEELAGLFSVIKKLQATIQNTTKGLDTDIPNLHASLLAFVQLSGQIKSIQIIEERDRILRRRRLRRLRMIKSSKNNNSSSNNNNNRPAASDYNIKTKKDGRKEEEEEEKAWMMEREEEAVVRGDDPLIEEEDEDDDENDDDPTVLRTRDDLYRTAGSECDLAKDPRCDEIRQALKMATFAYYENERTLSEKLSEMDYELIHHKLINVRPGRVAHYAAVSHTKKRAVVGLRGTSTLGDLFTDCCGRAVPLVFNDNDESLLGFSLVGGCGGGIDEGGGSDALRIEIRAACPNKIVVVTPQSSSGKKEEQPQQEDDEKEEEIVVEVVSGHERITVETHDDDGDRHPRCHEGILISARRVAAELFEPVLFPLIERGYALTFCGHSLGAGTAVVAALLLRSKRPELFPPHKTPGGPEDPPGRQQRPPPPFHVYAFGSPPVLDHDSAIAACSYCTTIVNNADLISRMNVNNLAVSLACLRRIQTELSLQNMNPVGPTSATRFFRMLAEGADGSPLVTPPEWNRTIRDAQQNRALRKPEHLFVPGRVLLAYDPWTTTTTSAAAASDDDEEEEKHNDEKNTRDASSSSSAAAKDCLKTDDNDEAPPPSSSSSSSHPDDNEEDDSLIRHRTRCVETTGTSEVFQRLEIDGTRCFTDHLTSSYFKILGLEYEF